MTANAMSITAGNQVFPGNPRGLVAAVWLPTGQPHGHGLPDLSVVLGKATAPRPGINMVLGLHYQIPTFLQLLTELSGRTLRIAVTTKDEIAGFNRDATSSWTTITVDELCHEVTHEHDGGYSTLLTTSQQEPVIVS